MLSTLQGNSYYLCSCWHFLQIHYASDMFNDCWCSMKLFMYVCTYVLVSVSGQTVLAANSTLYSPNICRHYDQELSVLFTSQTPS